MRVLRYMVMAVAIVFACCPSGGTERRPDYEPKVLGEWTPEWPEPKPSFKLLSDAGGQYYPMIDVAWTWGAKGTVETDLSIVDPAHPNKPLYKLMVPQAICGVGAKAGMRKRTMVPFISEPGGYLQIRISAKGRKASSPKWFYPVQKERRQKAK